MIFESGPTAHIEVQNQRVPSAIIQQKGLKLLLILLSIFLFENY